MRIKTFSLCLLFSLLICCEPPSVPAMATDARPQSLEKVRAEVVKLGVGEASRATITLNDGRKVSGLVYQTRLNDFVIRESKTRNDATIAYMEVVLVERNRDHSHTSGFAIGAVAGVGAVVALIMGLWLHNEK